MEKIHFKCPTCSKKLFVKTEGNWIPFDRKICCPKCKRFFYFTINVLPEELPQGIPVSTKPDEKGEINELDLSNLLALDKEDDDNELLANDLENLSK